MPSAPELPFWGRLRGVKPGTEGAPVTLNARHLLPERNTHDGLNTSIQRM